MKKKDKIEARKALFTEKIYVKKWTVLYIFSPFEKIKIHFNLRKYAKNR